MNLSRKSWVLPFLALPLLLTLTGCGGFRGSKAVSPLDFLLPGSGLLHLQNTPRRTLPETNDVLAVVAPVHSLPLSAN